jgi:N6-adenosine-specific RNA methylase IME4/ParB-like chromosome segregation protein Spo0J
MLALVPIDQIEIGHRLRGISEGQVSSLVDSIAAVGLLNPITVYKRTVVRGGVSADGFGLVAGAHRLRACERLGLVEIEAQIVTLSDLERQIAECDENLCGTRLTPSERALFTRRRKEAYEALHPEAKNGTIGALTRHAPDKLAVASFTADTATKTGQSERTVQRDEARGTISERALASLRGTHLDKGDYLDELKRLPEAEQIGAVERDLAEAKAVLAMAKDIRASRQKLKHTVRLAHMQMVAESAPRAPRKLDRAYSVYYADPPWRFGVRSEVTGREKSAENHYPTMPTDVITMMLADLIGRDRDHAAVLFLWATNPMLPDALRVMDGCGFTYVHHWVWDKEVAGTGYWGRDCHELLLIGRRGDVAAPLPGSQPRTVFREKKGRHSAKPDVFAETIGRLFPGVDKIELFARKKRPGWDVWGFESEGQAPAARAKAPSIEDHSKKVLREAKRRARTARESGATS